MAETQFLFVYGTLRRGVDHPMQRRLEAHAEHIGRGFMAGQLYEIDGYPGVIANSSGARVVGDIYRLHGEGLFTTLDAYEGCDSTQPEPHEYRRQPIMITRDNDATLIAWVYLYNHSLQGRKEITSGDYLNVL